MNRREFTKISSIGLALLMLPATLFTTACSSVKALLNTVIVAVQAILKVAEPSAPWAVNLNAALAALIQAEAGWTAGGTVNLVIDALNTIANVCAVIPLTAIYSPLIDILVAGIDAVLTLLVPAPASTQMKVKAVLNPHRGRVVLNKPRWMQSEQGAFKEQFNKAAAGAGLNVKI